MIRLVVALAALAAMLAAMLAPLPAAAASTVEAEVSGAETQALRLAVQDAQASCGRARATPRTRARCPRW